MAKINAHGARKVGPTLFTERVRPGLTAHDSDRVYCEVWRLRSDGMIQTRIASTRPVEGSKGREVKHSGAFANLGKLKAGQPVDRQIQPLRDMLERRGATIVKEML